MPGFHWNYDFRSYFKSVSYLWPASNWVKYVAKRGAVVDFVAATILKNPQISTSFNRVARMVKKVSPTANAGK